MQRRPNALVILRRALTLTHRAAQRQQALLINNSGSLLINSESLLIDSESLLIENSESLAHRAITWNEKGRPSGQPFLIPHALVQLAVDRKSTRLNSSHVKISYAVFCLKKK